MLDQVNRIASEYPEESLSIRVAVDLFGERSQGGTLNMNKARLSIPEDLPLQLAKRDIAIFSSCKLSAEEKMAVGKSELSEAKRVTEELALRIVGSRVRARARRKEFERLKKLVSGEEEWILMNGEVGDHQYVEVIRELETAKQELSNLKLDMASVMETKMKKEEETKILGLRMQSCLMSMEELEKEIEEVNEEHVLVELARIEASKESREVEAQRKAKAEGFSRKMEEVKARMEDLIKDTNHAEELEMKLAITSSDLDVLQSEMVFVRAMGKDLGSKKSKADESNKNKEAEAETMFSLQTAKAELEAAKKELFSIREEGFHFMSSMDAVREEMKHVSSEASQLRKLEEKADITVQNLNSKLLRAKSKLEAATMAQQKSKAMVANLSVAMEFLRRDTEKAVKEKENMITETDSLKLEILRTDSSIDGMKDRLLAAMKELEAVKASELVALDRLKTISEIMSIRASPIQHRSTITISKFEYEYLRNGAEAAQELVDKKVAAAQAWVEALNASEKEALLQIEIAQREMQEIIELEEKELNGMEKALTLETTKQQKKRESEEYEAGKSHPKVAPPRKSFKGIVSTPVSRRSRIQRRSIMQGEAFIAEIKEQQNKRELDEESETMKLKLTETQPPKVSFKENAGPPSRKSRTNRRSSSSGNQNGARSPSVIFRKRRKMIPNLVKYLREKRGGKQNQVTNISL